MLKLLRLSSKIFNNTVESNIKYRGICSSNVFRENEAAAENAEPRILVEKDDNITLIGINREGARNAIDTQTAEALTHAISTFESDDTSPVGVLYGVGGTFCAGGDLTELEEQVEKGTLDFLLRHEGSIGPTRRHLRKPVVCAINGFCVASGLELALLCDLRVMEDTAVLGFFNRRLGVPICDGGTVRLAASVGVARALDLITTGRRINCEEALKIGLVNRAVATGTALGQAVNLAYSIAKYPLASLKHDRELVYENFYGGHTLHQAIQNEIMYMNKDILAQIKEGAKRYRDSEIKGAQTRNFNVKEPNLPDWEQQEVILEKNYAKNKTD